MDHLWAPWRLAYVANPKPTPQGESCFLCDGLAASDDRAHLIAQRTPLAVVVLNRFPYNNGHLLIAPQRHVAHLADLSAGEHLDVQATLTGMVALLDDLFHPEGYNLGVNLGRVAGAGLPGHLHWHLVPRWNGDTNFMPVLADTKVIVQSLEALYDQIVTRLERGSSRGEGGA